MSERHSTLLEIAKLRRMIEALCKLCDLRFVETRSESSVHFCQTYSDGSKITRFPILKNDRANLTHRYKTILEQMLAMKNGFWQNLLVKVPDYSSLEELELKLTIIGLM